MFHRLFLEETKLERRSLSRLKEARAACGLQQVE